MTLIASEPGVQFYTGHGSSSGGRAIGGRPDAPCSALCLEPRFWPDAPNHPHFPSIALRPNQRYHQISRFVFSRRQFCGARIMETILKYNPLGRTDPKVSALCLGSMTRGTQNTAAEGHAQIDMALDHGINFIDTAEMYPTNPLSKETQGNTERIIGDRIEKSGRRDDVVVASNLSGDILSDLGPACTGTIGVAPSANINPTGDFPSLFEPVHGSAPDIAGQGIANPVGQIWTAAMMLEHLGFKDAATCITDAIDSALAEPTLRTRDLGGNASTGACGKAIAEIAGG